MLKRPPMPEEQQPQDIPDTLIKIQEVLDGVVKSAAGYFTLSEVYSQVTGGDTERKRGLPILRYGGSLDGVNAMTLECDLAKVPQQYLPHVISPLCNVHAQEMLAGLTRMQQYVDGVLQELQAALNPTVAPAKKPKKTKAAPAAEGPLPENYFDEGEEVTG